MNNLSIIQSKSSTEQVTSSVIEKLYQLALTSKAADPSSSFTMNLQGNISVPAAYEDSVEYLQQKFQDLIINVPVGKFYLRFKDPVIEQWCITHCGDGVGVTQADAAGVSSNFWGYYSNVSNGMPDELKPQVTCLDDFQYFTGTNYTENIVTDFNNATSITFPNKTFYDTSEYSRAIVKGCENIQHVNYGNAQFIKYVGNHQDYEVGSYSPIDTNKVIVDWDNSLIPNQTNLDHIELFAGWTQLQKILYPEGLTKIGCRSLGNKSLQYIEFPTTIISIGNAYDFGRNNNHRIGAMVVKATTPPNWYGWRPNETSQSGRGFGWDNFPVAIYVPDSAVATYKSVANNGTNQEQAWASPYIQDLIKPLSELPQIYLEMGTVTQEDIDRV